MTGCADKTTHRGHSGRNDLRLIRPIRYASTCRPALVPVPACSACQRLPVDAADGAGRAASRRFVLVGGRTFLDLARRSSRRQQVSVCLAGFVGQRHRGVSVVGQRQGTHSSAADAAGRPAGRGRPGLRGARYRRLLIWLLVGRKSLLAVATRWRSPSGRVRLAAVSGPAEAWPAPFVPCERTPTALGASGADRSYDPTRNRQ